MRIRKSVLKKIILEVYDEMDEETAHQEKFRDALKKYNVSSPNELSDEDKKKFFNDIDAGTEAKGETDEAKNLVKSLAQQKGVKNPQALAAAIGRKKYGKGKFQKAAAAGKSPTK